jgi:hypothetical protein
MEKDGKILFNHRYPGYIGIIGLRMFFSGKYDRSIHHYKPSNFNNLIYQCTNDNFICSHRADNQCGILISGSD